MPQVMVRTTFGEICFVYNAQDELTAALQGLESQVKEIEQVADKIGAAAPRLPKVGYEQIYRFTPDGHLELFRYPTQGTKLVAVALFAYHPQLVPASELELVTGIVDVEKRVMGQTYNKNKQYFRELDDRYGLQSEGIKLATETIASMLASMPEAISEDVGE